MLKSINVEEHVWEQLVQLKLKRHARRYSDVIEEAIAYLEAEEKKSQRNESIKDKAE